MKIISISSSALMLMCSFAYAQSNDSSKFQVSMTQNLKGIAICFVDYGEGESSVRLNSAVAATFKKYNIQRASCDKSARFILKLNVDAVTELSSGLARYHAGTEVYSVVANLPAPVIIYKNGIDNIVPKNILSQAAEKHLIAEIDQLGQDFAKAANK